MLRTFSQAVITTALLAAVASSPVRAGSVSKLCALPTASLEAAVSQYAGCADALKEVNKHAIATWYTDRESVESYTKKIADITAHCDASTRLTLVVYGLPNKDCEAGYSAGGVNKNTEDYKKWVQLLSDGVGQRKVLYVLEPDAVGLMAKGGCGSTAGYAENIKAALQILSRNPNADIYMDVGYWTLMSDSDAKAIATTVKELVKGGRLKGIALNTSNYRSNKQMSEMCSNFQKAYGDTSLNCIVDTSRNYNESPPSSEWCNSNFGGVGRPPTAQTGFSNLDYFIWIKPAGESDGTCDGAEHNAHSMRGPGAGQFFKQHFETLWNNGYFVKEKNYPVIGSGSSTPTQKPVDQATTTSQIPSTTTPTSNTQSLETTSPPSSTTTTAPVASTTATEQTTTAPPTEAVATTDAVTTTSPTSTSSTPSTPSAQQYASPADVTPSSETRKNAVSTTPAPESSKPKKKKKKTKTKCDSGLEPLSSDAAADNTSTVVAAVKIASLSSTDAEDAPATVAASSNSTEVKKAVSLSSTTAESASAPASSTAIAEQASTKADGSNNDSGIGGGAIAGIVAAAVVAVASAAVAFRRRGEARRRANSLQTPVEIFGPITATASRVQML